MTSAARSSAEASPWVLTCRGKFLEVLPAPGFSDSDGDAPPRPPRAASVPADVGRSPRGTMPFAALEPSLETFFGRLRLFHQSMARMKGGNAMDNQTSEGSAMTMCDLTRMWTSTTMCLDDDVHGDDVTERASTTSTVKGMTKCPDSNDARRKDTHVAQTSHAPEAMNDDPRLHGKMLMIRNIPCRINHDELVRVIDQQGFGGRYDFVNMPQSHRPKTNIGYAFVNLVDAADEDAFELAFNGFRFQGTKSQKVCMVQPARLQGGDAQLGHRRRKGRGRLASTASP